jgi:hypothetical protein
MKLSEKLDLFVSEVEDQLKSLIAGSHVTSSICNELCLTVDIYGYTELVYVNNELTFLCKDGENYSLFSECTLHDLIDIIKEYE